MFAEVCRMSDVETDDFDDSASSTPDPIEIAVAAAMGRQYAEDSRSFLRSLAELLEEAMPGEATIARSGLFGGDKRPIRRIDVSFTEEASTNATRYSLEDSGHGSPSAVRTRIVRAVALKTEPITVAEWIGEVSAAIARRAVTSRATRDALRSLG